MKEKPILMSGPMVRAILAGAKTQTRRPVKPCKDVNFGCELSPGEIAGEVNRGDYQNCPYGQPGDRLYVAVPLPGYDGRYCIDTTGQVWTRAKGEWKRLKSSQTSRGYASITPAKDGKHTTKLVHRLMCEAFYGPSPAGKDQVRHLDGNRQNNAVENLDWGTQEQNWTDRAAQGAGMGSDHHSSRLCEEDAFKIRWSDASQRSLAREYGVSQSTIWQIRAGQTWTEHEALPPNMPRWGCRLVLEIVSVRVERLQKISEADAYDEGTAEWSAENSPKDPDGNTDKHNSIQKAFRALWDSIYAAKGQGWEANPWVWVVEFKRVEVPS
jgi:hypothetical protein